MCRVDRGHEKDQEVQKMKILRNLHRFKSLQFLLSIKNSKFSVLQDFYCFDLFTKSVKK